MELLQHVETFTLVQKITVLVNRYEIRMTDDTGGPGDLLAVAQQKRAAFREQVTFYADEARSTPLFSFQARQRLDLGATYDVLDADGRPIGSFRKDFGRSLFRSTWHLHAPGLEAAGSERSAGVAVARRLWDLTPIADFLPSPFLFHFDFLDPAGRPVMTSERRRSLRDSYRVTVPGGKVDGRVAAALAVALDALQAR
ncbi:LURP-one-related/scramblase family protein [Arthrobacter sp. TMN-37]